MKVRIWCSRLRNNNTSNCSMKKRDLITKKSSLMRHAIGTNNNSSSTTRWTKRSAESLIIKIKWNTNWTHRWSTKNNTSRKSIRSKIKLSRILHRFKIILRREESRWKNSASTHIVVFLRIRNLMTICLRAFPKQTPISPMRVKVSSCRCATLRC